MLIQPKQSKGEETLVRQQKQNMSGLQRDSQHLESWSCSVCNTNLSKVGHSTEALQLQVESAGDMIKKQPHAAGQVLSWQEVRQEIQLQIKKKKKPTMDHNPIQNPTIRILGLEIKNENLTWS